MLRRHAHRPILTRIHALESRLRQLGIRTTYEYSRPQVRSVANDGDVPPVGTIRTKSNFWPYAERAFARAKRQPAEQSENLTPLLLADDYVLLGEQTYHHAVVARGQDRLRLTLHFISRQLNTGNWNTTLKANVEDTRRACTYNDQLDERATTIGAPSAEQKEKLLSDTPLGFKRSDPPLDRVDARVDFVVRANRLDTNEHRVSRMPKRF